MKRLGALALVTAIAVAVVAGIGRPPMAAAQMTEEAALDALRAELTRVGLYLAYFDQVNRLAVAQGQLPAAEADNRLRAQAAQLFNRSFAEASFAQLVDQHRRATASYFARVEQEVAASTRWPANRQPELARQAARALLYKARLEYDRAVNARHDPLLLLLGATSVRGWAMGFDTPPPALNPFAGQWERITAAIPSPNSRAVIGQIVESARAASTGGAAATATPAAPPTPGARPIPGEMGRPTPPPGVAIATPPPGATPPPDDVARGNALVAQYQFREALAAFDSALRRDGRSADAMIGRGRALNALGDVTGARQAYEFALSVDARRPYLRSWFAEVAMAAGDLPRAEAALADELRLAPTAWAHSMLGTLRLKQGREPEARQAMATAMRTDPVVARHRYENATFLGGVGQYQRALVEFASVLALDPGMTSAHYGLAVAYAQVGRPAQAIQAYEAYLARDATSEWAQRARQEVARLRALR